MTHHTAATRPAMTLLATTLLATTLLATAALAATPIETAPVAPARPHGASTIELTMREAALLVGGEDGGSVPMALLVLSGAALEPGDAPASGSSAAAASTLVAQVEVDGRRLRELVSAAADGRYGEPPRLDLFVYALRDDLEVVDAVTLSTPLDTFADAAAPPGLRLLVPLAVSSQPVNVRALLRVEESFGLRSDRFEPRASPAPLLVGPSWPVVYPEDRRPSLAPPWSLDGDLPTSRAVAVAGSSFIVDTDSGTGDSFLRLEALGTAPHRLEPRRDAEGRTHVDLPFELEPGLWRLRLVDREGNTEEAAAGPALELAVVEPETTVTDWRDAIRSDAEPRAIIPSAPPVADSLRRREQRELMVALYRAQREAFATLVSDGFAPATAAWLKHERQAYEQHGGDALEPIAAAQTAAFRELAVHAGRDGRPDAMLPALLLVAATGRAHLAARQHLLARLALERAATLSELWVAEGGAERAEAGRLLGVLALRPLRHGAAGIAADLLRRALLLAPDDPALRLVLGALEARDQRFDTALEHFDDLLASHPDHPEAQLRRGLVARRLGDTELAREALEAASAAVASAISESERGRADWVGALAAQELVRLELEAGRPRDAATRARAALTRHPEDPSLRVALAWALEAAGDVAAARSVLAGLRPAPGLTARGQIVELPVQPLAAERRRLLAAASARRAVLGECLDQLPQSSEPPTWTLEGRPSDITGSPR
ncbi:MAG: tetratricopeptide repeat protein [Acidobacteriota bacterium]